MGYEYEMIMALRLIVAAVLGGVIGLERERLNKSAGFRTHTLVCLGSCLIMMTSIEMFQTYGSGLQGDPGRIAAQVVTGVGFIGAGAIMRSNFGIKGLTTAATLWVVAGIGLAVGSGNFYTSILTTLIVYIVLTYLNRLEKFIYKKKEKIKRLEVLILDHPGQLGRVSSALGDLDIHITQVDIGERLVDNKVMLALEINIPHNLCKASIEEKLLAIQGVYEITLS